MAVLPICYKMPHRGNTLPIQNLRKTERSFLCDYIAIQEGSGCFSSFSINTCHRGNALFSTAANLTKTKIRGVTASKGAVHQGGSLHSWTLIEVPLPQRVRYAARSSTNERQLRSLHSYFEKLQGEVDPSMNSSNKMPELLKISGQDESKKVLKTLDAYLGKLNDGKPVETQFSISKNSERGDAGKLRNYMELRRKDREGNSMRNYMELQPNDETSDLYLISILASINIAVLLFEIATPIRNSDMELFSLPSIYGAKINHLILVGEWWRLVTPMFLHSGLLHVALGCAALLTFGPQVSRGYGSFTFFLIYMLGGISGNLTSFLLTPEPSVGGTGPVFAIIGAWLIYQNQNKDVIPKDLSESMFQKAIIFTALSFILSNFGPIDDWTHFGAAFTGMVYGYFTSPTLQLDDASSRTDKEEGITLVKRYADPCKSLIVFTLFVLILCSLVFFFEPPLNTLESDEFL